ncbi:MAG: hypothetical protein ACJ74Z_11995 [Bryobacteraceae bacterium]
MRNLLAGWIFPVLIVTSGVNAVAEPILALVHNYAAVESGVLKQAEKTAARVLATGGVQVHWLDCQQNSEQPEQCENESDPSVLVLHVLPAGVTRRGAPAGSLGFAVPSKPGEFGALAGVFYDRVKRLSSSGFNEPVILGHAIAHELGHLLLGFGAHTEDGIMKAEWHPKELKRAENATLVFDPGQRSRIRQNLKTRLWAAHIADHTP